MYVGYHRGKVNPRNKVGNGKLLEMGSKKVNDGNIFTQCGVKGVRRRGVLKGMVVAVMSMKAGRVEDCGWQCGRSANKQLAESHMQDRVRVSRIHLTLMLVDLFAKGTDDLSASIYDLIRVTARPAF